MKKVVTSCIFVFSIGTAIGLILYKLFHRNYVESLGSESANF